MSQAYAPLIIAHRGASHAHAENTRAAFEAALDEGADGIELDLQFSADGVPVVFHDDFLTRIGGGRRRIADFRLAQLRALDFGSWFGGPPARILTLDEVLDGFAHRTRLYLEIKHVERRAGRHRALARAVAARLARDQRGDGIHGVSVLSFFWRALDELRRRQPAIARVRNVDAPWMLALARRHRRALDGLSINIDRFGTHSARALAAFACPLFAYTCDTPAQLARAQALGIGHIITNAPARSRRLLQC